ncbi:MAG TPA: hypothetical protein ENK57_08730 [Polyangiaceae bacterium]|nr:hypothetical protein [Polyangiaceae bacterium]
MGDFLTQRYELLGRVSCGPVAELHRGLLHGSAGFSRPVAVRRLRSRFAKDPRFVGTWAAAVTELARRPHANVEQMLDLWIDGEQVYFISDWLDGVSLETLLSAQDLPWPLVARALSGVLAGLHRLHTMDPPLIHRGVGAAAVRVSSDGQVVLTRSGIAAALAAIGEGRTAAERAGLWHPAPEIRDGEAPSPASDVFGLGLMAFEALGKVAPFDDDLEEGPADLAPLCPDAPPLLVAVIERALRIDPKERFLSAAHMARALDGLLRTEKNADDEALGRAVLRAQRTELSKEPSPAQPEPSRAEPAPARVEVFTVPATLDEAKVVSSGEAKLPKGLNEQNTIHLDPAELTELHPGPREADEEEAKDEPNEPARYRFEPKDRSATERARGLADQESVAIPLMLKKTKTASPSGLEPASTEFLDSEQVDRLTVDPDKRPRGLGRARTEFLDGDDVDRLTLPEAPANQATPDAGPESLDEQALDAELDALSLELDGDAAS